MTIPLFAHGLLDLWAEEGGECPHGRGFIDDCPGAACEGCGGSGKRHTGAPDSDYTPCWDCGGTGHVACRHDGLRPVLRAALTVIERESDRRRKLYRLLSDANAKSPGLLAVEIEVLYAE